MILFLLQGEEVNEETLALAEIHKTGPHGNYMVAPLTRKYMKSQSRPKFFDRMNMEAWKKIGSPDCYRVALEKAKEVLATHQVEPLSASVTRDLRKFIEETEMELGVPRLNPDFNPTQGFLAR
jgi:trimethylamine--corrinoid protein Co-methyltransferase